MIRKGSAALSVLIAVLLCNLPDVAQAQSSEKCTIVTRTVQLELPAPGEFWFKFGVANDRWVYLRPADVVSYWKNGVLAHDPALAELLESQLPLDAHVDLADIVPNSSRIMVYTAADLLHEGKAALSIDGDVFLREVVVEKKSGPPCNSTRDFYQVQEDGARTRLFHITDLAL